MIITVEQLSKLAANLSVVEILTKLTKNTADDWIVAMLRKVADNEEFLEMIANFLNFTKLFGASGSDANLSEPELPDCCKEFEPQLTELRSRLQSDSQ